MLAWQVAGDLCDVATLGGAKHRADLVDLAALARYPLTLAVYDADPAGDQARAYLESLNRSLDTATGTGGKSFGHIGRIVTVRPPAHDLSDYWRSGKNLRAWIAAQVAVNMKTLVQSLDPVRHYRTLEEWNLIMTVAVVETRLAQFETEELFKFVPG